MGIRVTTHQVRAELADEVLRVLREGDAALDRFIAGDERMFNHMFDAYRRADALDLGCPFAWNNAAVGAFYAGLIPAMRAYAQKALEKLPNGLVFYNLGFANLAMMQAEAGAADAAIDAFTKSYAEAGSLDALVGRAHVRTVREEYDGAIQDCDRVILGSGDKNVLYDAWNIKGLAQLDSGLPCVKSFDEAVALDAKAYSAYTNRGIARARAKDYGGAEADFSRALELVPGYALIWFNRAILRLTRLDKEGYESDLTRAMELNPTSALAFLDVVHHGKGFQRDVSVQPALKIIKAIS